MAAARGRVMTRSHITRIRAAIWLLMVAMVESAPPRRLLGFSFMGNHMQKLSPPPEDPWRTLYAKPPPPPFLKEYLEIQAYQASQEALVREEDSIASASGGVGLVGEALNQLAMGLKTTHGEKAPNPVPKGPAKCPPGVPCLDGVIFTMPDHTDVTETLKSDSLALTPLLVSPKPQRMPTKTEVAIDAATTMLPFLKPMLRALSAPPPPPPPHASEALDLASPPPVVRSIGGVPILFDMGRGFQPPIPLPPIPPPLPPPLPPPPPPPPLSPPMPPPPFRPPLSPPIPPVTEHEAEDEAFQEEPQQQEAAVEAAVEDSSGGGHAAEEAAAAEEASQEAPEEAKQELQKAPDEAKKRAQEEAPKGTRKAPEKAKHEVQEEEPKRMRKILQKLRALTGAKQTKTSQVPTKGSARTWTQADFDEDDEPSTMRKLSSMLDEAKGRRANLLSRLKAISNEG